MDLRHITGELIFQGNRRALYNLIRIFMRITHISRYSRRPCLCSLLMVLFLPLAVVTMGMLTVSVTLLHLFHTSLPHLVSLDRDSDSISVCLLSLPSSSLPLTPHPSLMNQHSLPRHLKIGFALAQM